TKELDVAVREPDQRRYPGDADDRQYQAKYQRARHGHDREIQRHAQAEQDDLPVLRDDADVGLVMHQRRIERRKARVSACAGSVITLRGGPSSTTTPRSMKMTRSPTSRAKFISWVTTSIVMPDSASRRISSSTPCTS